MSVMKPIKCTFNDLAIGEYFKVAMTHAYESSRLMKRVCGCEEYNAVWVESPQHVEKIPHDMPVLRSGLDEATDNTIASSSHTMVLINPDLYAFKDRVLTGDEWLEIHSSAGWACMPVCAEGIWMCINENSRYCFVFTDEAEQFSQPYPTVREAMEARKRCLDNL